MFLSLDLIFISFCIFRLLSLFYALKVILQMYVGVIFGIYNYMCFERGNDFFFCKKKEILRLYVKCQNFSSSLFSLLPQCDRIILMENIKIMKKNLMYRNITQCSIYFIEIYTYLKKYFRNQVLLVIITSTIFTLLLDTNLEKYHT